MIEMYYFPTELHSCIYWQFAIEVKRRMVEGICVVWYSGSPMIYWAGDDVIQDRQSYYYVGNLNGWNLSGEEKKTKIENLCHSPSSSYREVLSTHGSLITPFHLPLRPAIIPGR